MIQEVEITIRGEFNAEISKDNIKGVVQDVLNKSDLNIGIPLEVIRIKEEAELYSPNKKPMKQCLNEVSVEHGWNDISDVISNAKNRFVISSIIDLAINKFEEQYINEQDTDTTSAKGED